MAHGAVLEIPGNMTRWVEMVEPNEDQSSQPMMVMLVELQLLKKTGSLWQMVTPKLYSRIFFLVLGLESERRRAVDDLSHSCSSYICL